VVVVVEVDEDLHYKKPMSKLARTP